MLLPSVSLVCAALLLPATLAHIIRDLHQRDSDCRCFPGDDCWPSSAEWAAFNRTIGGRLIATVPIASSCHDDPFAPYDAAQCAELQANWLYPETHYSTASSVMAQFFANMSCDPFTERAAQCVLGTYVQYAVNAQSAADYQKTLAFVESYNIRLAIRNTGHDYFGKSTGAGALALWTHNLKGISFSDYKSKLYTGKAIKVGAGVQSFEAFKAAHEKGLVVVGGNCESVGLAGGYTQGGGHSLLAATIGLAADQVLEWEVVTASGKKLTASPTKESDLYWALSGGGGGAFAAVVSVTLKAYPDFAVAGANLTFTQTADVSHETFLAAVQTFLQNLPDIVDAGASTLWTLAEGFFQVSPIIAPKLTADELKAIVEPTLKNLDNSGIAYSSFFGDFPTFLDGYNAMNPPTNVTAANLAGRLLPRTLVEEDDSASNLVDTLDWLVSGTTVVTAGLSTNVKRGAELTKAVPNSVNPAWRSAIHNMVYGLPYDETDLAANVEMQNTVTNVYGPKIDELFPDGPSSYLNEGDFRQPDFQEVFYGGNYKKLLAIKDKYDPNAIFYGLTAVGSERWTVTDEGRLCKA